MYNLDVTYGISRKHTPLNFMLMPNIISYFSFKRKKKQIYRVHELSNDEITGEGIFAKI